uniref:hypothetical protein n=1 Tax=Pseudomonas sp. TaxID=306 RepID=UPI00159EC839|nr:hypothetical protein [Pseudomonas sp.]
MRANESDILEKAGQMLVLVAARRQSNQNGLTIQLETQKGFEMRGSYSLATLGVVMALAMSAVAFASEDAYFNAVPDAYDAPSWANDDVSVTITMGCEKSENYIGWSSLECYTPAVLFKVKRALVENAKVSFGDEEVTMAGSNVVGSKRLYKALYESKYPALSVYTASYDYDEYSLFGGVYLRQRPDFFLADFRSLADSYVSKQKAKADRILQSDRTSYLTVMAMILAIAIGVIVTCVFAWRKRKQAYGMILKAVGKTRRYLEGRAQAKRTFRLVSDSSVTVTLHGSDGRVRQDDASELRKSIQTAVDRGDIEGAKILLATLENAKTSAQPTDG